MAKQFRRAVQLSFLPTFLLLAAGCATASAPGPIVPPVAFGPPARVQILGYAGNIMEPFLSRDGATLLFNNLNQAPENTNLHWATRNNDTTFQYRGEVAGVNTADLEAVPTLDQAGHLYFVSNRNYATTLSTLYAGTFAQGTATGVHLLGGVSRQQAGWVNFDVEVSADGQALYFVDARFDQAGTPQTADLVMAASSGAGFQRLSNSEALLKNVNTDGLEYAAGISADQLTLYFTRVAAPLTAASVPEIMVATRATRGEAFGPPAKILAITGFAEAPTLAPDQKTLYFHRKENNKFELYLVRRK